jgi:predicted peptidase
MKRRCWFLLCFVAVALHGQTAEVSAPSPTATKQAGRNPGGAPSSFQVRTFKAKDGQVLDYSLFVPAKIKSGEKIPLVLCLHGAGGNTEAAKVLATAERQAKQPCIIMAPACDTRTARWVETPFRPGAQRSVLPELLAALDAVMSELPVDPTRVYITGQSMGGIGTWGIIVAHPERFAAAIPVCGHWQPDDARKIASIPIWAFHGEKDPTVPVAGSRNMIAALKTAGAAPRYTEYPGMGHNSWISAYATDELWEWVFAQQRKIPQRAAR